LLREIPERLARFVRRRSWRFIAIILVLSAAVPGIMMLEAESGFDTLVSGGSQVFQDNACYEEQLGSEPITVLLSGQTDAIFSTNNLAILKDFEYEFLQDERYHSIVSPATILQMAAYEVLQARQLLESELALAQEAAAQQAIQAAIEQGLSPLEQEAAAEIAGAQVLEQFQPLIDELYQIGEPSLENPLFVNSIIYNLDGSISS
jgi:predicted RND superfamily exporter protein